MDDDTPQPFAQGTFAVFDLPDGGVVLATNVDGHGEFRQRVPPAFVAIAKQLAAGQGMNPATVLKALRPSRKPAKALEAGPGAGPGA